MSAVSTPRGSTEDAAAERASFGEGSPAAGGPDPRSPRPLALTLITLVLIAGASAAFLLAQSLKLEPSPLDRPRVERIFSPTCGCATKATATLAFTVTRPLRVDAEMIDREGRRVRGLAAGERWDEGRRTLQWDGRDDAGRLAAEGPYRLQVRLLRGERDIVIPTAVTVDTTPPRVALLSVTPRGLPRAVGRRPSTRPIEVRYRASEAGSPTLFVDGRAATRRRWRPPGRSTFEWGGRSRGRPLPAGVHDLAVVVRDRAGNLGRPSERIGVRVRGRR
jgi:hypothetical protein